MFDKLEDTVARYEELMNELSEPDVANDPNRFKRLMKEQSDLTPLVETYREYKQNKQNIEESLELLMIFTSSFYFPINSFIIVSQDFLLCKYFYIIFVFFTICTYSLLFLVRTNIFKMLSTASSVRIPLIAFRMI